MKLIILLIGCCALSVNCEHERAKRIVGGEKAAIPKPIDLKAAEEKADNKKAGSSDTSSNAVPTPNVKTTNNNSPSSGKWISGNTVAIYEEERTSKVTGVLEEEGYVSFKGIRFAKPPLSKNRFQRPVYSPLTGDVDATKYGNPCVQPLADNSGIVGDEDCLFLNVYTPSVYVQNATGLPVFFWVHGGGFTTGSGNQYGPLALVKKDIVVVTMNYRLGTLGFLGGHDQQMAGNAGLFDVRAALEWTRRYIVYFGGNPGKIIPAGQGNGASIAMLIAQSGFTSGFIKGVFAMSGTGISSTAVDYSPGNTSNFIAESTNCVGLTPLKTVRCLQTTSIESLFNVGKQLQEERIGDGGFVNALSVLQSAAPMVEGANDGRFLDYFLNNNPLDALKKKTSLNIPLLMGTAKTETGKAVTGKYKEDVLQRLQIPDFLTKVLPKSLINNNVGVFIGEAASKLINTLFGNDSYLGMIFSLFSQGTTDIEKVIQTTTDALFNLPATTTLQLWDTAGGETYLYSFEHETVKPSGKGFLDGLSLFSGDSGKDKDAPANHGDDLLYLFDLQTLQGDPEPDAAFKDSKDVKVKSIFVNAVAEFLHNGKPKIAEIEGNWPAYKKDQSYAVISDKPKYEKKFRYCEIALWGGFIEKLTDPFCNLPGIDSIIKALPQDLLNAGILNPNDVSKKIADILPGKNLLGNTTNALTNVVGGLLPTGNNKGGGLLPTGNGKGGGLLSTSNGKGGGLLSTGSNGGGLLSTGNNGGSSSSGGGGLLSSGNSNGGQALPSLFGGSSKNTQSKQTTSKTPVTHIQLKLPGFG